MAQAIGIQAYWTNVKAQQTAARQYIETALRAYYQLNPDTASAEFREFAENMLEQVFEQFGNQAAAGACQKYDEITEALKKNLLAADIVNEYTTTEIKKDVRYYLKSVEQHGFDTFVKQMVTAASDHVFKAANKTMERNARRDTKAGIRYARVPSGKETCGFCLLLASRGFAYRTKQSAGYINAFINYYHSNCDCLVVAGTADTTIEGYNPDWYYNVYVDACYTANATTDTKEGFDRVINEINRRGNKWTWFGEKGTISQDEGAKPLLKEISVAEKLVKHGFDVHFRETVSDEHRCDIYLTGSGKTPWEIKQPTGNGTQTIYHQFEEAAVQARRLVLDISELDKQGLWNYQTILNKVNKYIHWHFKDASGKDTQFLEVLIVEKNGDISRIKREG